MTLSSRHQSNMPPAGSHDGNVSPECEQSGPSVPQSRKAGIYMAVTGENTAMPFNFRGGKINSCEKPVLEWLRLKLRNTCETNIFVYI